MALADLLKVIPSSNAFDFRALRRGSTSRAKSLADVYSSRSGFHGAFIRHEDAPFWSKDLANYHRDEFHAEGTKGKTRFSDLYSEVKARAAANSMAGDLSSRALNFLPAIKKWLADGKKNVMPFSEEQDYGSCVDASFAALVTALLGWRAANPQIVGVTEEFIHAAAWWLYSFRGYCSDGWDGFSLATQARKHGMLLRRSYSSGSSTVDLTDDDKDESLMARTYCRSGPPQWMQDIALRDHPFEDGACFEFDGETPADMMLVLAAGGCLHFGGTRTSGGSRPYTVGSVGGHQQTCYGGDGSEEFRRHSRDVIGIALGDSDFAIINDQTWGSGFDGECADKYWPSFWQEKPQGAWVWKASQLLNYFSGDIMAWLPKIKGIPGQGPPQPPVPSVGTKLNGTLYTDAGAAIRGTLIAGEGALATEYIIVPNPLVPGTYQAIRKIS